MNTTMLDRRIRRFSKANLSQSQCDIASELSRDILLNCVKNGLGGESAGHRGLLLYEQNAADIAAFANKNILWDQIPFSALATDSPGITAGMAESQYHVVISNLAFDWLDAGVFIRQLSDLLVADGVFWFTAYGAGTAINSRTLLAELDQYAHFNDFYEMQEIGDALAGSGFKEVSLSSNVYTLEYTSVEVLMADAYRLFGINLNKQGRRSLGGRGVLNAFKSSVAAQIKEKGAFKEQIELMVAYGRKAAPHENASVIPVKVNT